MHKLFFDTALTARRLAERCPWSTVEEGRSPAVAAGAAAGRAAGRRAVGGIALPGIGNLHSHTFQRGFAGLTGAARHRRRPFLDLARGDVPLLGALDPGRRRGDRRPGLRRDAGERLHRASPSSTTCTTSPTAGPMPTRPNSRRAIAAAAADDRHRPHAAAGVLRPWRLRRPRRPPPGSGASSPTSIVFARSARREPPRPSRPAGRRRRHRAAFAARRDARGARGPRWPLARTARSISMSPSRSREVEDCLAATGARPVDWLLDHAPVDAALVPGPRHPHDDGGDGAPGRARGAVAGPLPDHRERTSATASSRRRRSAAAGGRFGVGSDSNVLIAPPAELRTLEYSQRLRDRARNRLAAARRLGRPPACSMRALRGRRAGARPAGRRRIGRARRADLVVLDPDHPALYGRRGDTLLDSWIFAAATSPVRDVFAEGVTSFKQDDTGRAGRSTHISGFDRPAGAFSVRIGMDARLGMWPRRLIAMDDEPKLNPFPVVRDRTRRPSASSITPICRNTMSRASSRSL